MSTNSTIAGIDLLRLDDLRQLREPRIGHLDDADVGLDGAEGIVLRGDARLGQRVEQGGLAHVGQSDDAAFQAHINSSPRWTRRTRRKSRMNGFRVRLTRPGMTS